MIKKFLLFFGIGAMIVGGLVFAGNAPVTAAWTANKACSESGSTASICADINDAATAKSKTQGIFGSVTNVLLFILGGIAVIVIIVGGILMITSAGDPGKFAKGRNGVIYALIGLVVAISAYVIINFVLGKI